MYIFYSKSVKTCKFVNIFCKNLIFWENCLCSSVILRDFSFGLSTVILRNNGILFVEKVMIET